MANPTRISNELNHVQGPSAREGLENPKKCTKHRKSLIYRDFLPVSWGTLMQGRGT